MQPLLPDYHYHASATPTIQGGQMGNMLVLLAAAVADWLLAVLAFHWRNATVGAWPWQRAHPEAEPAAG